MVNTNSEFKFPKGLLFWAGHRGGGVKKPFIKYSGLPTGEIIRTNLIEKIDSWILDLLNPEISPANILLLIGGPGNGKTETVEYFIKKLDEKICKSGELLKKCEELFSYSPESLPSMKEVVTFDDIEVVSNIDFDRIEIVHDASVSHPSELINDIENVYSDKKAIYIACINRGILAHALGILSKKEKTYSINIVRMFEKMLEVSTLGPEQPQSWPLDGYPNVILWPMDIESLVDDAIYDNGYTPAYQIFKKALNMNSWIASEDCPAGELCPFHTNLQLLSDDQTLKNLISIFNYYEIVSGKRWTFRELFSLVSQLIVGHENDFYIRDEKLSPCQWAAKQVEIINSNIKSFEKVKARFNLISKLYVHSLFPRWPDFKEVSKNFNDVLKIDKVSHANANDFFRLLSWLNKLETTETAKIIRAEVGSMIEPAQASGNVLIGENELTVGKLEEVFSFSVRQGYDNISSLLSKPEVEFVKWIVEVEKHITIEASYGNKNYASKYQDIAEVLKQFTCRLAKRSLLVRSGSTKDVSYIKSYAESINNELSLKKIRKIFDGLIHEKAQFPVSLTTTFGQPIPYIENDAKLYASKLKITYRMPKRSDKNAKSSLPYLMVGEHAIPLTFTLYKALLELNEGLMRSSFPADTLALIEWTRAMVAGMVVRDDLGLEDAVLNIAGTDYLITIDSGNLLLEENI